MTLREIPRATLPETVQSLLAGHSTVVATPATDDIDWAVRTVWDLARAIAKTGKRVALIDLSVEEPMLHREAREPLEAGIVDAFVFGGSMHHVAQEQDVPGLHFIGVGTRLADQAQVLDNPRWQRLSKGFASEEAVLLLFVPPSSLEQLALLPDLLVVLSPEGFPSAAARAPQIHGLSGRGVPVAVVTADEPDTAAISQSASTAPAQSSSARSAGPRPHASRARRLALASLAVAATVVTAAAVLLLTDLIPIGVRSDVTRSRATSTGELVTQRTVSPPPPPTLDTAAPLYAAQPPARPESGGPDATARPAVLPRGDSLFYTVQVVAFARLGTAVDHGAQLQGAGFASTVSAVRRGPRSIWYRVLVGALPTVRAAVSLRQELRAAGVLEQSAGVLLHVPHALELGSSPDSASGRDAVMGLRQSGILAYIVPMPDGSVRLLTGAFETPDQAYLTDSLLPATDVARILVPRTGTQR